MKPNPQAIEACELALAHLGSQYVVSAFLRGAIEKFRTHNRAGAIDDCNSAIVALPDYSLRTGQSYSDVRAIIQRAIDLAKAGK